MVDRTTVYIEAVGAIVAAEPEADEIADELFRFARVLEGNDELFTTLGDPHIPAERRLQICQDLLGGKASDGTVAVIGLLVGLGRVRDLPKVVDGLVEARARARKKEVAEVRVAVELSDDQRQRLATALSQAVGNDVDVKVVIDPSVMGGVLAQIGDQVIDGTVRSRLNQLKDTF